MKNLSKIYPVINNRMELKVTNRLNTFCVATCLIALNAKQATLNFCLIISILIILMAIHELFVVKNFMRLVLS